MRPIIDSRDNVPHTGDRLALLLGAKGRRLLYSQPHEAAHA
jgi:hypothetical protein